jgi:hypothetical protein
MPGNERKARMLDKPNGANPIGRRGPEARGERSVLQSLQSGSFWMYVEVRLGSVTMGRAGNYGNLVDVV